MAFDDTIDDSAFVELERDVRVRLDTPQKLLDAVRANWRAWNRMFAQELSRDFESCDERELLNLIFYGELMTTDKQYELAAELFVAAYSRTSMRKKEIFYDGFT
jgi:hypothetical protein